MGVLPCAENIQKVEKKNDVCKSSSGSQAFLAANQVQLGVEPDVFSNPTSLSQNGGSPRWGRGCQCCMLPSRSAPPGLSSTTRGEMLCSEVAGSSSAEALERALTYVGYRSLSSCHRNHMLLVSFHGFCLHLKLCLPEFQPSSPVASTKL